MEKVHMVLLYNSPVEKIPVTTAPFFQEYSFSELNPETHAILVIERLLAYGNRVEVRWLFDTYGKARLRSWLTEMGSRRLPRRRYHLWCVLLDVPEDLQPRRQIWPY